MLMIKLLLLASLLAPVVFREAIIMLVFPTAWKGAGVLAAIIAIWSFLGRVLYRAAKKIFWFL
jgi:hypothetical protein